MVQRRKLCSLGTGEMVHILHYEAREGMVEAFEVKAQSIVHSLYSLTSGITDIRVCHPRCGQVCIVITFLSRDDMNKFVEGPQRDADEALSGLVVGGASDGAVTEGGGGHETAASFQASGSLMPACHTLSSLLCYLKEHVKGAAHTEHDVRGVQQEIAKWFPRPAEYEPYIMWDLENPTRYTRNLVFRNEHMDVILMCWPAGQASTIHDHDSSSCWVVVVEGTVDEVQYAVPMLDRHFIESEMKNPTGAVGRCGELRVQNRFRLEVGGCTSTYANNDIGLHRVENNTDQPAYTLHIYAPPLSRMKIFKPDGQVSVTTVAAVPFTSELGRRVSATNQDPDGVVDVEAWNSSRLGKSGCRSPEEEGDAHGGKPV